MPEYTACLAVVNGVHLGRDAGRSVTSGTGNVLLGDGAGAGIVDGSHNVILGGVSGGAHDSDRVVIGTGSGTVRMEWTSDGDVMLRGVRPTTDMVDPDAVATVGVGLDVARGAVAFKHRDASGVVHTSVFRPMLVPPEPNARACSGRTRRFGRSLRPRYRRPSPDPVCR